VGKCNIQTNSNINATGMAYLVIMVMSLYTYICKRKCSTADSQQAATIGKRKKDAEETYRILTSALVISSLPTCIIGCFLLAMLLCDLHY
jgi:hypothetical protein